MLQQRISQQTCISQQPRISQQTRISQQRRRPPLAQESSISVHNALLIETANACVVTRVVVDTYKVPLSVAPLLVLEKGDE